MPDPTRSTVSSTEVSALFGISPWVTEFMLYQRFANGESIEPSESDRMSLGKLMQPVILELVRRELRLDVEPWDETRYLSRGSLGATLDATIICPTRGAGVVECKNVDWRRWRDTYHFDADGNCTAAPPYYEIQAQVQMWVSRANWAVIATLVGGNELVLLERVPDRDLMGQLEDKAAGFLERVRGRNAPDPMQAEDLGMVQRLMPTLYEIPPLDLRGDEHGHTLAEQADLYEHHRQTRLEAKALEDEAKAATLFMVQALAGEDGTAPSVVLCDDGTVKVTRTKDTLYRLPQPVLKLLEELDKINLDDDEDLDEAVRAVRALEGSVQRRGGIRLSWKPREAADG